MLKYNILRCQGKTKSCAGIGAIEPTWRRHTVSARIRGPWPFCDVWVQAIMYSALCIMIHNAAVAVSSLIIARGTGLNRIRNCTNGHLHDIVNLHRYRALFM